MSETNWLKDRSPRETSVAARQQGNEHAAHENDRLAHVHVVDAVRHLGLGVLELLDGLPVAVELRASSALKCLTVS